MNENAQQALAQMINLAIDGIEGAKTFAEAQLPDVVEQLLTWKMLESLISVFFALLFWGIAIYLVVGAPAAIRRARKAHKAGEEWTRMFKGSDITSATYDFAALGLNRLGPALVLTLIGSLCLNFTWLQILVAPKIYLLEYASDLIK